MDQRKRNILGMLVLRRRSKKTQAKRKCWVNPYLRIMNPDGGHFKKRYETLKVAGEANFFQYFRMSVKSFEELLSKISPRLQKRSPRKPVDPMEMLGLTIR